MGFCFWLFWAVVDGFGSQFGSPFGFIFWFSLKDLRWRFVCFSPSGFSGILNQSWDLKGQGWFFYQHFLGEVCGIGESDHRSFEVLMVMGILGALILSLIGC